MNNTCGKECIRLKKRCASLNRRSEIYLAVAAFFMILVLIFPRDSENTKMETVKDLAGAGSAPQVEEVVFSWTPERGVIFDGKHIIENQVVTVLNQFENPKPVVQLPHDRALFAILKQSESMGKSVTFRTIQK